MNLVDLVTLPARVALAFAEASLGVARLVDPDGPVRLAYQAAAMTSEDRPLGQAIAPGGVVGRPLPAAPSIDSWSAKVRSTACSLRAASSIDCLPKKV